MGSGLAWGSPFFSAEMAALAALTTVFLQILSNLANDYGDFVSGVDLKDRIGPTRALQSGAIQPTAMKRAVILFAVLALLSGLGLLAVAWRSGMREAVFVLLGLGLAAIAAAIMYTVGKRPYGYMGLGDVFVFVFFGLVGVGGSFYLVSGGLWDWKILLPAASVGLLSAAVLNLNNMRDAEKDALAGKRTLAVMLGRKKSKVYHTLLLMLPFPCMMTFFFDAGIPLQYHFYLVAVPMMGANVVKVQLYGDPRTLDPELKKVAIGTFLFAALCASAWYAWLDS
jgi:1,4-dihydroxy-2-naphthoate octaprenyltransferase